MVLKAAFEDCNPRIEKRHPLGDKNSPDFLYKQIYANLWKYKNLLCFSELSVKDTQNSNNSSSHLGHLEKQTCHSC